MDVVVSWNLRDMVKLKTRREVRAINIMEGYKEIEICTPNSLTLFLWEMVKWVN